MKAIRLEHGQSLILIALLMVGMVAFLGLVVDGGRGYAARRQSQNASDAAAFAGARVLAYRNANSTPSNIWNAIRTFALRNGVARHDDVFAYFLDPNGNVLPVNQTPIQIRDWPVDVLPPQATGVLVSNTLRFQPFLITVLSGNTPVETRTRAAVQTGPPRGHTNLMPMTILTATINFDGPTRLYGTNTGSGNFSWVSYDCQPTEQDLAGYLDPNPDTRTSSGLVSIGDWLCPGTGQEVGEPIRRELDIWETMTAEQRLWIVPIFGNIQGSGNTLRYQVVGFAEFLFIDYNFTGPPDQRYIDGQFIQFIDPNTIGIPAPCNVVLIGPGICGVNLVR